MQLNPHVRAYFVLQRMPGFRVNIGFGLHAGWAVEGPIGSNIKVDCSYLGPHQDMVSLINSCRRHATVLLAPRAGLSLAC